MLISSDLHHAPLWAQILCKIVSGSERFLKESGLPCGLSIFETCTHPCKSNVSSTLVPIDPQMEVADQLSVFLDPPSRSVKQCCWGTLRRLEHFRCIFRNSAWSRWQQRHWAGLTFTLKRRTTDLAANNPPIRPKGCYELSAQLKACNVQLWSDENDSNMSKVSNHCPKDLTWSNVREIFSF